MTNATSQFFFFSPSRVNFDCCVYPTIMILFVGCNKDSEQLFFCKKKHRTTSALHFTACVFNNRCVSSVLFQLFFTFHITVLLQYYINSCFWRLCFFFFFFINIFYFFSHTSHNITSTQNKQNKTTDTYSIF